MGIEHLNMDITLSLLWIFGAGVILISVGTVIGFILCSLLRSNDGWEDPVIGIDGDYYESINNSVKLLHEVNHYKLGL